MDEIAIVCVQKRSTDLQNIHDRISTAIPNKVIIKSVVSAQEGFDACAYFEKNKIPIAMVLSDSLLSDQKGEKFLEQIEQLYPESYKVMLLHTNDQNSILYAIEHANLFRYLFYPLDTNDLFLTFKNALQAYINNKKLQSYKKNLEEKIALRTEELMQGINRVHEYAFYTLVDEFGIILESSKSFASICGVTVEEIVGKSLFDTIAFASYETVKKIKTAMQERVIFQGEVLHQYLEYRSLWTDIKITPNITPHEKVTFTIKRYDISDKKYIEELCDTDVLTGLYNRRFFNTLLPKEIQRIKRERVSFAFLMIDIDYFKKYNDTYGHQQGDKALSLFSSVLQNVTQRGTDFAFRLGGEEFAIIVSDISKDTILYYANSINRKLLKENIVHETSDVSNCLSASIGAVLYEDGFGVDDLETMTNLADKLLYEAKRNGRNQVVLEIK